MPTEPMLHDGTFFQEKAGGDRLSGMREAAGQRMKVSALDYPCPSVAQLSLVSEADKEKLFN